VVPRPNLPRFPPGFVIVIFARIERVNVDRARPQHRHPPAATGGEGVLGVRCRALQPILVLGGETLSSVLNPPFSANTLSTTVHDKMSLIL